MPPKSSSRLIQANERPLEPLFPSARLLLRTQFQLEQAIEESCAQRDAAIAEGQRHTEQARIEAERLLEQARDGADAIRAQAALEGHAEGAQQFAELLRSGADAVTRLRDQFAAELVPAALLLARAALGAELTTRPEQLAKLVMETLSAAKAAPTLDVFLHPDDLELIRPHESLLQRHIGAGAQLSLHAQPALPRSAVRVSTDMGEYEGGLDARLGAIERALRTDSAPTPQDPPAAGATS